MRCDLPYLAYANSHKRVPRPAHLSRKSNSRSPPVPRTVDISGEDTASEKKIETGLRELHDRRFSGPGLDSPVVTPKEPIGHCQDHVLSVRPCRIQEKTDFWTPLNRYLLATVAHTGGVARSGWSTPASEQETSGMDGLLALSSQKGQRMLSSATGASLTSCQRSSPHSGSGEPHFAAHVTGRVSDNYVLPVRG